MELYSLVIARQLSGAHNCEAVTANILCGHSGAVALIAKHMSPVPDILALLALRLLTHVEATLSDITVTAQHRREQCTGRRHITQRHGTRHIYMPSPRADTASAPGSHYGKFEQQLATAFHTATKGQRGRPRKPVAKRR